MNSPIPFSIDVIYQLISLYKNEHVVRKSLYSSHNILPFSCRPFPNDVSENIVRYFVEEVEELDCLWTVKENHDLFLPATGRKLEVKAFTNDSEQISFTCTQDFDILYVLDCRGFSLDKYILHIFNFSSNEMKEMEVGMDAIEVKFLSQDKRTVRVSLNRLIKFTREKGFYHEVNEMEINNSLLYGLNLGLE